jgi:hypothetical protein
MDGAVDRVGDRRHRRHDADLADPLGAAGVGRVRHLDQDRLDHRDIGSDRNGETGRGKTRSNKIWSCGAVQCNPSIRFLFLK